MIRRLMLAAACVSLWGQSTHSAVMLNIRAASGIRIQSASIECAQMDGSGFERRIAVVGSTAVLTGLPPGSYRIRVESSGFQPFEIHQVRLSVASFLSLDVRLRDRGDVWEQSLINNVVPAGRRALLPFYGPDLDLSRVTTLIPRNQTRGLLDPSFSSVIDGPTLLSMPLAGRDVYQFLALLPGSSSDALNGRGLGLSGLGQRSTSTNFLLDGAENNNTLITGPFVTVPPEAVGEYRVSTAIFGAEFGRTAGFLANAVSRQGGPAWHGSAYGYFKHDKLNANTFERNRQGIARRPLRDLQAGITAGGPMRRNRLWNFTSVERVRIRSLIDPLDLRMPTTAYRFYTADRSFARNLLDRFAGGVLPDSPTRLPELTVRFTPATGHDRWFGMNRLDGKVGERDSWMVRTIVSRTEQSDFLWSPYPDFRAPLLQQADGVLGSWTRTAKASLLEVRGGAQWEITGWERPHPEIPSLATAADTVLPGSGAFYSFRNRPVTGSLEANFQFSKGRQVWKAGAGLLLRRSNGYLTAGRDGRYLFGTFLDFATGREPLYQTLVQRTDGVPPSEFRTAYSSRQWQGFLQGSWRLGSNWAVSLGLRYENFGNPTRTDGGVDWTVDFGSGTMQRPASAAVHDVDGNNFAPRVGVSRQLGSISILRAGYGLYFDRPYENLWLNRRLNGLALITATFRGAAPFAETSPVAVLRSASRVVAEEFPEPLLYDVNRSPYVHQVFTSLESRPLDGLTLLATWHLSRGRKLVATDKWNRPESLRTQDFGANPLARLHPGLPTVTYRGNQAGSNFAGATLSAEYRSRSTLLLGGFTFSRSFDHQSEALVRDFFDLGFTNGSPREPARGISAFSRQFDSSGDWGRSDFDQPVSAVVSASRVFASKWTVSGILAARSGQAFTVFAGEADYDSSGFFYNRRADVSPSQRPFSGPALNRGAFSEPAFGTQGRSSRNGFRGPFVWNLDCNLGRTFRIGEKAKHVIRLDVFNPLNRLNWGVPESTTLSAPRFGVPSKGLVGRRTVFPGDIPFVERGRMVQIVWRILL